jgi:2-dehydro-3-deoxyphosphogluconate aldolase/(4S)-4-hydroxy-2-oxoglutarate aldolase
MLKSDETTVCSAAESVARCGIAAVLVINELDSAVPVAEALMGGGVTAIELTLRTPQGLDAIAVINRAVPEMVVIAGTVLTPEQIQQCRDAGADMAVAPGLNPRVLEKANDLGLPFMPGICTASDIEKAVEMGCRLLKFFPAEPSGGVKYLKSVSAPYNHLDLHYMPLGGLSESNFMSYFSLPSVFAIGGSWIATSDLIARRDWDEIRRRAHDACTIKQNAVSR